MKADAVNHPGFRFQQEKPLVTCSALARRIALKIRAGE